MRALSNLFKISIHIVSFGGKSVNWNHVSPDTNVDFNDVNEHTVEASDMALYHNWENHFDLLIKENLGLKLTHRTLAIRLCLVQKFKKVSLTTLLNSFFVMTLI